MDILNIAQQWAKSEIFSSKFFIVAAIVFIAVSIGFWQLGKSELAKSFITPMAVCGGLLLIIGAGLVYNNHTRVVQFAKDYSVSETAFIESEIERTDSTISQTNSTIYVAIPIIIIVAALLIILFDKPLIRAWSITVIAMMATLLIVDSNSQLRIQKYNKTLKSIEVKK